MKRKILILLVIFCLASTHVVFAQKKYQGAQTVAAKPETEVVGKVVSISLDRNDVISGAVLTKFIPEKGFVSNAKNSYYYTVKYNPGDTFGIRLKIPERSKQYQFCISIDGVSAIGKKQITGDPAQIATWKDVESYVHYDTEPEGDLIKGWRNKGSDQSVSRFKVVNYTDSLAARMDTVYQAGWIVIAVFPFEEKEKTRSGTRGGSSPDTADPGLGVAEGEKVAAPITETQGQASSNVATDIFYFKIVRDATKIKP